MDDDLIAIGKIVSAHGIKGEVVIQPYNQDAANESLFNGSIDKKGNRYALRIRGHKKQQFIVAIDQVTTRNMAEELRGIELYVPRKNLPELDEEEYYYTDLIGLKAVRPDRTGLGIVTSFYNYGAGDILEIEMVSTGDKELVSFVKDVVPEIHIDQGYLVVVLPEVLSERDSD